MDHTSTTVFARLMCGTFAAVVVGAGCGGGSTLPNEPADAGTAVPGGPFFPETAGEICQGVPRFDVRWVPTDGDDNGPANPFRTSPGDNDFVDLVELPAGCEWVPMDGDSDGDGWVSFASGTGQSTKCSLRAHLSCADGVKWVVSVLRASGTFLEFRLGELGDDPGGRDEEPPAAAHYLGYGQVAPSLALVHRQLSWEGCQVPEEIELQADWQARVADSECASHGVDDTIAAHPLDHISSADHPEPGCEYGTEHGPGWWTEWRATEDSVECRTYTTVRCEPESHDSDYGIEWRSSAAQPSPNVILHVLGWECLDEEPAAVRFAEE